MKLGALKKAMGNKSQVGSLERRILALKRRLWTLKRVGEMLQRTLWTLQRRGPYWLLYGPKQ